MSFDSVNNRFASCIQIVNSSGATSETSSTTAKAITGSTVSLLPKEAADGTTFKWTIAGTKTSTNNGFTITLVGNGTTLLTLTSDASTAVDWMAEIILRFTNPNVQKLVGKLLQDTEDPEINYAAATADFSAGGSIVAYVTATNGSDTLDAEMCIVERWI
jgi:hypothetical protein